MVFATTSRQRPVLISWPSADMQTNFLSSGSRRYYCTVRVHARTAPSHVSSWFILVFMHAHHLAVPAASNIERTVLYLPVQAHAWDIPRLRPHGKSLALRMVHELRNSVGWQTFMPNPHQTRGATAARQTICAQLCCFHIPSHHETIEHYRWLDSRAVLRVGRTDVRCLRAGALMLPRLHSLHAGSMT